MALWHNLKGVRPFYHVACKLVVEKYWRTIHEHERGLFKYVLNFTTETVIITRQDTAHHGGFLSMSFSSNTCYVQNKYPMTTYDILKRASLKSVDTFAICLFINVCVNIFYCKCYCLIMCINKGDNKHYKLIEQKV